jgi:hypothetical protein
MSSCTRISSRTASVLRRMKQCAELGAGKIVRRMGQGYLQAGASRGEGNDIVALERRRAERLRFEAVD